MLHGVVLSRGGGSGGLRCQLGSPAGWCWIPRAPSLVWVPLGAPFFRGSRRGGQCWELGGFLGAGGAGGTIPEACRVLPSGGTERGSIPGREPGRGELGGAR